MASEKRPKDARAPAEPRRVGRTVPLETALVFVAALVIIGHIQWICPWVVGVDSYFHEKMAVLIRDHGPVRDFPWTQFSTFRDHFSDSSFLFHVLLIPFTYLSDEIMAIKLGAVVLSSVFFAAFFLFLRIHRCRVPALFTLLLGSSGSLLLYRLCQNRGYLLSMLLALMAVEACLSRRHKLLFVVAVLYPLSYTACHVVILLAILHNVAQLLSGEKINRSLVPITVAGVLVGLLLHPNGKNAFILWWIQNVRVLTLKWTGGVNLFFGGELYPPELKTLLFSTTALAVTAVTCSLATLLIVRARSTETISLFVVAMSFGFLTLLSKRFIEYSAPFGVAYAAFLCRDLMTEHPGEQTTPRPQWLRWLGWGITVSVLLGLFVYSYLDVRRDLRAELHPNMKKPAEWLKANTPPGDLVYTADWDDFPELFYYNSQNRYLICLDPTFFYEFSPTLWKHWYNVSNAYIQDVYNPLRLDFKTRWVLATNDFSRLISKMNHDPRFTKRFDVEGVSIFEVGKDLDWITQWAITGPYTRFSADIDRDILAAVEKTPPALGTFRPTLAWMADRYGSFIDLERLYPDADDVSAFAMCRIESPVDQTAELRLGFDDAITVWLRGRQIFSDPGPSEVTVDGRRIGLALVKGPNTLVVKCINYKRNWGFYARLVGLKTPLTRISPIDR